MILWKHVKHYLLKNPNQLICEEDSKMTFEEAAIFAESFVNKLFTEKCCVILCKSEMMASLAMLSCFAAGVTAVPLSVRYGKIYCDKILKQLNPTAIITDVKGELEVRYLDDTHYEIPQIHPAVIMYTSGTTGVPKGVMLTETNLLTNVIDICKYLKIDSKDSILIARPLYHCAVLTGEFLTSIFKGVKIHFYSRQFNPKTILDLISENKITVFCATPTLLSAIAKFKRKKSKCPLEKISISGECMDKLTANKIADAFSGADIYHVYGLTEAGPRVSYLPPSLFSVNSDCVGIPLESVFYKVLNKNNTLAKENEEGTLWVNGRNVMSGYYNDPEQTSKVLKDGWLNTGDIAVIDSNGLLKIKGRSDDMIIRAGMNIYPQEIEAALKSDMRVNEARVYKIDDEMMGVKIALEVSGNFSGVDEVRKLCAKVLPSFQIPSVIKLVEEIEKNATGKIIRKRQYA